MSVNVSKKVLIGHNLVPRVFSLSNMAAASAVLESERTLGTRLNRPFPSSPKKTRVSAQPLIWKSFFILMQIKLIFTRKVVHLASF